MSKPGSNPLRLVSHMLAAVFNSRAVFHREWERGRELGSAPGEIAGRWVGEWISEQNGHRGELKCVLSRISSGTYRACFYASFSWLFRVGYVTQLEAKTESGRVLLHGEEDLGPLAGGIYRCEGEVQGEEFNCRYSCRYDHGIFRLKRLN